MELQERKDEKFSIPEFQSSITLPVTFSDSFIKFFSGSPPSFSVTIQNGEPLVSVHFRIWKYLFSIYPNIDEEYTIILPTHFPIVHTTKDYAYSLEAKCVKKLTSIKIHAIRKSECCIIL